MCIIREKKYLPVGLEIKLELNIPNPNILCTSDSKVNVSFVWDADIITGKIKILIRIMILAEKSFKISDNELNIPK